MKRWEMKRGDKVTVPTIKDPDFQGVVWNVVSVDPYTGRAGLLGKSGDGRLNAYIIVRVRECIPAPSNSILLDVAECDWHSFSPIASVNLHANGVGKSPGRHLSACLRRRGLYAFHELVSNLIKIGASENATQRRRQFETTHKRPFTELFYVQLPFHLEGGLHEICKRDRWRREYFHFTPRVKLLAEHIATHAVAIVERCDELFADFIKRNLYFDFERAVLWILNPQNPYPPPFAGIANLLDLGETPIESFTGQRQS